MDEITTAAAILMTGVLTAGVTWLFAMMRINKMNAPTPLVQLETVDSAHAHVFARLQGDKAFCIVAGCEESLTRDLSG